MLNQFMNDFNAWFDSIKGQLEGDIALNLASQVTNLPALALTGAEVLANKDIVSAHLSEKATLLKDGHVQLSSAIDIASEALGATSKAVKLAYDKGNEGLTKANEAF